MPYNGTYLGGHYFGGGYFGGLFTAPEPDLVAACKARLLLAAPFVAAVGQAAATPKVFGDRALGSPAEPYVVIGEPGGRREYSSEGNYIESGQLTVSVYAAGKLATRQVARTVEAALNDAPLLYDGARLMMLRFRNDSAAQTDSVAPGQPALYQRVMVFDYQASGQI